jgi:acylphosphatase
MSTSDVSAREVVVRGIVQGVFFRAECQREARRAGVDGWARNQSDGTVRAYFEGPPASVESMVAWCRHGPRDAVVDDLDVVEREPSGVRGFDLG